MATQTQKVDDTGEELLMGGEKDLIALGQELPTKDGSGVFIDTTSLEVLEKQAAEGIDGE